MATAGSTGDHNFWVAGTIQPLDLGFGCTFGPSACRASQAARRQRAAAHEVTGHSRPHGSRGTRHLTRTAAGRPPRMAAARPRRLPSWSELPVASDRRKAARAWAGTQLETRPDPAHTPRGEQGTDFYSFFTRTCVWRNLSKATTVVQLGRPFERGRRDHHRRQCHHHCPGPLPEPTPAGACHE